jgi:hypothetical protein
MLRCLRSPVTSASRSRKVASRASVTVGVVEAGERLVDADPPSHRSGHSTTGYCSPLLPWTVTTRTASASSSRRSSVATLGCSPSAASARWVCSHSTRRFGVSPSTVSAACSSSTRWRTLVSRRSPSGVASRRSAAPSSARAARTARWTPSRCQRSPHRVSASIHSSQRRASSSVPRLGVVGVGGRPGASSVWPGGRARRVARPGWRRRARTGRWPRRRRRRVRSPGAAARRAGAGARRPPRSRRRCHRAG